MSEENKDLTTQSNSVATSQDGDTIELIRYKMEQFTLKLNQPPNPAKITKHKTENYHYLPISNIEKDLQKMFFGLVQFECISYQQIFNEIGCHARIKVFHPVINQWLTYDGVGSAVIQQDKDTKVIDFQLYKKGNALQLALPKAYAEAIKNAAKKIGKRFGADINRKIEDVSEYEPFIKEKPLTPAEKKHKKEVEKIAHLINDAASIEELENIHPNLLEENRDLYDEKYAFLKD